MKTTYSFKVQRTTIAHTSDSKRRAGTRAMGLIMLLLAGVLAWHSNWFHAEKDLSGYPEIRLTYTTCKFERIFHSKSSRTEQIVFTTENGRYLMEDGVWRKHFDGPALAATLSRGGTVRAWVHPDYPRTLRGIVGGVVDIPPQWGVDYDQRNMQVGIWVDASLALAGIFLFFWNRSRAE